MLQDATMGRVLLPLLPVLPARTNGDRGEDGMRYASDTRATVAAARPCTYRGGGRS